MMQTLTVNLGERFYPIYVGDGILSRAGDFLQRVGLWGKVAVITNPTVVQLYLDVVHDLLSAVGFDVTSVLIFDGEQHKDLQSLSVIYDRLISERFEHRS